MRWARFFILPVVLFTACVTSIKNDLDKIGAPYWAPEWGLPVLSGEFGLGEYMDALATEVTITEDQNKVIVIEYRGPDVASDIAENMISVPDQSYNASLRFDAVEAAGLPVALTLSKSSVFDFVLTTGGADELDSMVVKSGLLNVGISGDFPASGQLEIIFNPITLNGTTFSRAYSWTYDPANPGQSFQENIDLTGAFIDFTKNNTTTNNFHFEVRLTINYEGQPVSAANTVNVSLLVTNPKFSIVYGRFSQRSFNTPRESVLIGLLENVNAVNFYLANPQIDLNFKSSFGLPAVASLSTLIALNNNGDSLAFTGPVVNNTIPINNPDITQVGSFVETSIQINKDNSNITDIIAFLPNELVYEFNGSVEPQGTTQQFVLDTSRVIASYAIKLPLSGTVSGFDSEMDFDFDGSGLDQLKKTKLIVRTVNGLPLSVGVSLIFLDANNIPLDTLFDDSNILNSGTLDAAGFVVEPTEVYEELLLDENQLNVLQAAKKIKLRSTLFTGINGTEVVNIRSSDKVKISLFIQTAISF